MDKKNIAIIILSVALVIALIGLIAASAKVSRITAEKGEFMQKISATEDLAEQLSRNMEDLKAILGKSEKEKEKLAREKEAMKKRLEDTSMQKEEIIPERPQ